jgi:hypothetical protein
MLERRRANIQLLHIAAADLEAAARMIREAAAE